MEPMKLLVLTNDRITSYSPPKKNSPTFHLVLESYVEWACTEAEKGIEPFDRLETSIEINLFEFLDWIPSDRITEFKTHLKSWIDNQ